MPPVRYQLPPLADDADFDRLCRDLFRHHWTAEGDQLNGRSGQRQDGVDFYGRDPQGRWRGGQSKSRNSLTAPLGEAEVREEVRKALEFTPALHEYIIATSGPRDARLQQVAREITDAHRKRRPRRFSVKIYFWDDLLELLHQYPEVRAAYYGQLDGTEVFGLVEQLQGIIQNAAPGLLALGAGVAIGSPDDAAEKVIADAAASTDRGRPDEAIVLLGRLRSERWESLGKPTQGRLLANLGFAHATQHNLDMATTLYEAAAIAWPGGLESQVWHLLALLERGPREEAYALADALREQHPDHARVAALWVAAAPDDRPMAQIEAALPAPLRAHAEVALALGRRASRVGDLDTAERHSRAAHAAAPGWEGARDQLGVVLLERAAAPARTSGKIPTDSQLPENQRRDAREAHDLLAGVLAQLPPGTLDHARARISLNLATAETLLGDALAADRHIGSAWLLHPTEPIIAIRYARWCMERGQRDAAIDALAALPAGDDMLDRTILLAHYRIERDAPGDREAAETLLRDGGRQLPVAPPSLCAAWLEIFLDLLGKAGRHEDARQLLGDPEGQLIAPVARHTFAARMERRAGDLHAATAAARVALAAVDDETPPHDREGAALLAESFEWWADAIPLWVPLATAPGPATYHLIECARRAEDDQVILDICRALREGGHWDPRCLDVEVAILVRYHDQDAALALLERAIPLAADEAQAAHFRVNLAVLARQLDRTELADAQLPLLPVADAVEVETGRAAVEALRLGPNPAAAVAYAYDLWRRFPDDVATWEALLSSFNLVDGERPQLPYPSEVAPGTAVALREEGDGESVAWIIEDGAAPRRAYQELPLDDPLVRQLLGHRAGEVVTVAEGLRLRRFTVAEIVPKAVHRWRWCMEQWSELFPEQARVWTVTLPENPTGPGDFAELNARLYEARAARERVVDGYQTGPLSLHTLAEGLGGTVVGTVGQLAAMPDLRVRSWSEDGEGLLEAFAAIRMANTLVLDLSALGTLLVLDAVDLLADLPMSLAVARGALDLVREQARSAEARASEARTSGGGTLAPTPLGPLAEPIDSDVADQRASRWRALVDTLESHAVAEPGLPLAAVPAAQRRVLVDIFGQIGAETMALAGRPGRVLWTDDWAMGWLGRHELGLTPAWTQPVLARLADEGFLDRRRYRLAMLRLNACGYTWTLLDADDLALALRELAWDVDQQPLAAALDWLGTPILTPVGSVRLVGALLVRLWREAPTGQHAARVTRRICDRLLRRTEGRMILQALYRNLDVFFGLDVLRASDARDVIADHLRAGPRGLQLPLPERYWHLGGT